MGKFIRCIVVGLIVLLLVETSYAAKECETKSKRLLCAKVIPTGNVCKVPANVGKIINVTVKQTMGDTVCNKAAFPLETGAKQAYTWHGDEIYRSDDCSAVFNVEYEKCKTVTITRCKATSKRLRCDTGTICSDPKVDNIINATVIRTIRKTVCNQAAFPLDTDASQTYTWNGNEIHKTEDCKAVFKVYYETCTQVVRNKCKPKSKELRCAKKVVPSVCKIPKVGEIINISVKQPLGDTVCNQAAFPLETDATQAYTWDRDGLYRTDDCMAVFNVEYEKCKTVTVTKCKATSKRLRCDKSTVCSDPKVDRIINATVIRTIRKTVCNQATFPLDTDASRAYTWNGNEIHTTEDCQAVFKVFYETCKEVVRHRCRPKSRELRCPRNVVLTGRVCRVPEVDRIISASVHRTEGGTVCNQAPFPLAADASQAYTWNADEIHTTDDCKAVFNVEYEKCKAVTGKCYIHGDPHVTSADGFKFTIQGPVPCDYYLVTHRTFKIIGSLTACYRQNMSCLHKIQIDFKGETVFLGQGGDVTDRDGNLFESSRKIEIIDSGNRVEAVLLKGKARGVTVTWNKKTNAEILIPKRLMNKINGLCGDYDGDADNDRGPSADSTPYLVDSTCPASDENGP